MKPTSVVISFSQRHALQAMEVRSFLQQSHKLRTLPGRQVAKKPLVIAVCNGRQSGTQLTAFPRHFDGLLPVIRLNRSPGQQSLVLRAIDQF
jgi:hypothetical protein